MPGGIENPLGARAMYLGSTLYRIHGSNEPETIGQAVSSGCFRMTNEDVTDLYKRVSSRHHGRRQEAGRKSINSEVGAASAFVRIPDPGRTPRHFRKVPKAAMARIAVRQGCVSP